MAASRTRQLKPRGPALAGPRRACPKFGVIMGARWPAVLVCAIVLAAVSVVSMASTRSISRLAS